MRQPVSPTISAEGLRQVLAGAAPPHLLDVRWGLHTPSEEARAAYLDGHVPGAVWVDLETALSGEPGPTGEGGRHPMPHEDDFRAAMHAAGVTNGRPVIVYDEGNNLAAARAWWLLTYFGKVDVRVLDGGLSAWTAAGGPLERGEVTPPRGDLTTAPGALPLVTAAEVQADRGRAVLLDARPSDRFAGRNESVDAVAGHIPGAVNIPALSLLDDHGRFLDRDDLATLFTAHGLEAHRDVIVYCGSGVQAMHAALALELADIHRRPPRVYVGSWSDWITDPERPVEGPRD